MSFDKRLAEMTPLCIIWTKFISLPTSYVNIII